MATERCRPMQSYKFAAPTHMTIIIDLTNKCLSNNALRDFTYGFWQDLAATQPAASFTLLGPVPARAQPAANTILKPWRKTGLAWLDHARYRRLVGQTTGQASTNPRVACRTGYQPGAILYACGDHPSGHGGGYTRVNMG